MLGDPVPHRRATSSARPDRLRSYADAAAAMDGDLRAQTVRVRAALDRLRATDGWSEFLSDVPPLDIDLGAARARLERLADLVDGVGRAFREAGLGGSAVRTLDDAAIAPLVPDLTETHTLRRDGDRWIVSGTDDPDHIRVIERDGRYVLIVGRLLHGRLVYGDEIPLTAAQAANLVIRSGDGNDVIELPPDAWLRITVWTGEGDDLVSAGAENPAVGAGGGGPNRIFLGEGDDVAYGGAGPDEIYGGDGRDTIDGQDGADRIVGGAGFDTLYGGRSDDVLDGGRGDDYLEGGSDQDLLLGNGGDDVLSGGRGDDVLDGGVGNDRTFGGRGDDVVTGGAGRDTDTGETADVVLSTETRITVELEGDPGSYAVEIVQPEWMSDAEFAAWQERIDSDLELLRTTPSGRTGLEELDQAAHDSDSGWKFWDRDRKIVIVPYGEVDEVAEGSNGAYSVEDWLDPMAGGSRSLPGNYASPPGNALDHDALVSYGGMHPQALDDRPPVASLYHELSHSWDQLRGGTEDGDYTEILVDAQGNELRRNDDVPRAEINSVGHDLDDDGDIDTRPSDGGDDHPTALTENSLRRDLGWEERPSYTIVPGPGERVEIDVDE